MMRSIHTISFSLGIVFWSVGCDVDEVPPDRQPLPEDQEYGAPSASEANGDDRQANANGRAMAVLVDRNGQEVGTATLTEEPHGLRIAISVDGMEPGRLGLHVHEHGRCDPPDFESAGEHFSPFGNEHGAENAEGPHAGDLPNLRIDAEGRGENETLSPLLSLRAEETSVLRPGGAALIIHEGTDDYYTDPSGDAGDRIACGVIGR